jgi:hypothetical protein
MEQKLLNEQQQKRAHVITGMIERGVMPPMDELRANRAVLACGCPEALLRSVVEKNALVTRARANRGLKVPAHVAAKVRSRIAQIPSGRVAKVRLTQEQIDHLVDTRDLNLYPLSGYEQKVLAEREQRRRLLLDF